MAVSGRLVSSHFPYIPVTLNVRQQTLQVGALLDTGFDGHVIVPDGVVLSSTPPDTHLKWRLADGSEVSTPAYLATAQVGTLGSFVTLVVALGDESLIGRGLSDRFTITLDHGQRLVVEP